MEVDLQRAAPGGEARGEGNISADTLGAIHRVIEEKLRERLVDEFALGLEPTGAKGHHILDREQVFGADLETEAVHAKLSAGLPVRGIEHGVGLDELVGVRLGPGVAVAEVSEGGRALEEIDIEDFAEVQLRAEVDLLIPESARTFFAVDHAEERALVASVQFQAAIFEGFSAVKNGIAAALQQALPVPPFFGVAFAGCGGRCALAASGGASCAGINEPGGRLDRTCRNRARTGVLSDSTAGREGQTAQRGCCF